MLSNPFLALRLTLALAIVCLFSVADIAWGQSSPGLYNGQVPTAQQWNSYFQKKQDYPVSGFCATGTVYANTSGSTAALTCQPAANVTGVGSALKWTTPRTLSFTGGATGSGTLDGSGDVTINLTASSSGTVTTTGTPSSGQIAKFSGSTSITNAVAGTDYQAPVSAGPGIGLNSNVISSLIAAGGLSPGGRLYLTSGQPIPTADVTGASTLYYGCAPRKLVPYFDGTNDQVDTLPSCQVSTAMQSTGTGVLNSGGVFDVAWDATNHNICIVTNGSGGGWASDTGGSNTARGTGYSAVHNTRGYWTFTNTTAHCYNGSTDYGSAAADRRSYLGSIYTTAAGQTSMQMHPGAASGGSNPILGVWNAYNRSPISSWSLDNAGWTYTTNATRACHASNSNRVSWVDGLGQSTVDGHLKMNFITTGANFNMQWSVAFDSTSVIVGGYAQASSVGVAYTNEIEMSGHNSSPPLVGLHFAQCTENNNGGGTYQMNHDGLFPVWIETDD